MSALRIPKHAKSLVIGVFKDGKLTPTAAKLDASLGGALARALTASGFDGDAGKTEAFFNLGTDNIDSPSVVVTGLGDAAEANAASVRDAAANGVRVARKYGADIAVDSMGYAQASSEGAHLGAYSFDVLKTSEAIDTPPKAISSILSLDGGVKTRKAWEQGEILAQSQNFARHLAEMPSNLMTPTDVVDYFVDAVEEMGAVDNLKIHVYDKEWVQNRGMGAFQAVAKGSDEPLQFVDVEYNGAEDSSDSPLCFVGKGVTFDSGGISIKPSAGMGDMRADMGGAAAVLGAALGVARLGLPINMRTITPLCENMPSGRAVKPGDVVFSSYASKSIEVDNTDAEGRLILADALHYASELDPHTIVDVATLTGAMDVALGDAVTGVFARDDSLWQELYNAGEASGDGMWRMPLMPRYRSMIKSALADIKNTGGRSAGACTAAMFLSEFVPKDFKRWAHLDIAGTMQNDTARGHKCKGMSGAPTRALIELAKASL